MLHRTRAILALAILPVLALGLAACGSSNSSDSTTAAAGGAGGGDTVATKSIAGTGTVLVDSMGSVLYTNDMDSGSKVACTGQCLTEWVPLAAPSAGNPTSGDSAIQSKLGTMKRPDGTTQVTLGGKPLYSFVEDGPGEATGDGFTDDFGGTHFVWTAARAGGSTSSGSTTTTQPSGGYGGSMY